MRTAKIFLALSALFLITGCSYRVMDFTLISSKNVELSKFPNYERGDDRVSGEDTKPIIIIFPTGRPDGKEAIDQAIENTPGAVALVDGVMTYKYFYIPYIYGEYTYVVEGTPLIDPELANKEELNNMKDYSVCLLNKDGDLKKTVQLDKDEYYSVREDIINSPRKMFNKISE